MRSSFLVLAVVLMALGGCATDSASEYASGRKVRTLHIDDHDYMARTVALARTRGVDVMWVNPPRVKVQVHRN